MKTRSILMATLCSLMMGAGFASCADEFDEWEQPEPDPSAKKLTYILNQGLTQDNNANISSFYEIDGTPNVTANYYKVINGQEMGSLANAMIEEDDNIYVVLDKSKYVARLDMTTKEQARYTFPEGEGGPRCIDVEDDYAYVTQHGGKVSKLNIKDMSLIATFEGGDNLEGIVEKEGKLYVANTWKSVNVFNKEIIVIDAKTMTQTGSIDVVLNPEKVQEINDKIYVISRGNYFDVHASLQVIDTKTSTSKEILKDVTKITKGLNGLIYGVCSTYDENWNSVNSFFTYNPNNNTLSETSFLKDAPSALYSTAIYLLEVDEKNGYIYVGTSDYITNGTIYQFDQTGKLIRQFDSGGINPSAMIFID
jgi:hypothetical protein